nr:MAG TPA: Protein of unknown function (DUF2523) [Inoviridae sp.]
MFLKIVFIKALLFLIIFIAISYGIDYLIGLIETAQFDLSKYSNFGEGISYFLNYIKLKEGIELILTAFNVRFLIRRIPFIGS